MREIFVRWHAPGLIQNVSLTDDGKSLRYVYAPESKMLVRNSDNWAPNNLLSPTRLTMAGQCRRSEVLRYLHGLKTDTSDVEIGKVVGSAAHEQLEGFVGYDVPFAEDYEYSDDLVSRLRRMPEDEQEIVIERAPLVAKSSLACLPKLSDGECLTELQLKIDSSLWVPELGMLPFNDLSAIDLVWVPHDVTKPVEVIDYKTTVGKRAKQKDGTYKTSDRWVYVPSQAELLDDCQFVLELASVWEQLDALGVWQERKCQTLIGRWIYLSTALDLPPAATMTKVTVDPQSGDFVNRVARWFEIGADVVETTDDALTVGAPPDFDLFEIPEIVYPSRESPCQKFKGCAYHKTRGGPCMAGLLPR